MKTTLVWTHISKELLPNIGESRTYSTLEEFGQLLFVTVILIKKPAVSGYQYDEHMSILNSVNGRLQVFLDILTRGLQSDNRLYHSSITYIVIHSSSLSLAVPPILTKDCRSLLFTEILEIFRQVNYLFKF